MDTKLRSIVDLREGLQDLRIGFGNRIFAIVNGADISSDESKKLYERWYERFLALEKEVDSDIREMAGQYEIIEVMTGVKGVGKLLAAKVAAMIDIHKANTVSALWRYCGYAVIDGSRERPVKGEKLHYNWKLKTTCYLVGTSFLKCNSPYRLIYDQARTEYANKTEWTKGHAHNAAMRKMIKHWLSHLWVVWREMEGLPTRPVYVDEKLGHTHISRPEDYGWRK